MISGKNGLYAFLFAACLAGYIWLFANHHHLFGEHGSPDVCLFKNTTGIPCPACGSTRSVLALLAGDVSTAASTNPLGLVVLAIMVVCPLWIAYDVVSKRSSFFQFYKATESWLKKPAVAIPAVALILANWTWNIIKGL